MEVSPILKCPCNNRLYKNQHCLKAHKKTETHLNYMMKQELKDLKVTLTQKDNIILQQNTRIEDLRKDNEMMKGFLLRTMVAQEEGATSIV